MTITNQTDEEFSFVRKIWMLLKATFMDPWYTTEAMHYRNWHDELDPQDRKKYDFVNGKRGGAACRNYCFTRMLTRYHENLGTKCFRTISYILVFVTIFAALCYPIYKAATKTDAEMAAEAAARAKDRIVQLKIDNCEYLLYREDRHSTLVHKANCSNPIHKEL